MEKAVIYARFSSSAQREESIDTQVRICTKWAEDNDMTVIAVYADHAKSGRTAQRPEFQRMIKDSANHSFQHIILYTIDRFARNRVDAAIYKKKLTDNGVTLHYANQPMLEGPEGIMVESIFEGYAEYYSASLSRSVSAGIAQNTINGVSSWPAPYGYRKGADRHYEINPDEAPIIVEYFKRYANGERVRDIVKDFNKRGFRNRKGAEFTPASFNHVIENETYTGCLVMKNEKTPNAHPAIIDQNLWNKAQERVKASRTMRQTFKAPDPYLLTGKIYCGCCGAPMIGESGHSHTGKIYNYYKCQKQKREAKSCEKKPEKKDIVEEMVIKTVADHVLTDEKINYIADKVIEAQEKNKSLDLVRKRIVDGIADADKRYNNIFKAIENGLMENDIVTARLNELSKLKKDLEKELVLHDASMMPLTREHIIFYLQMYKNKKVDSASYNRFICQTVVDKVYIRNDSQQWMTIVVNLSEDNKVNVKISDIKEMVHLYVQYPNQLHLDSFTKRAYITIKKPSTAR